MLIRVDVQELIATVRAHIEADHLDYAKQRLTDPELAGIAKFLEGYASASEQIVADLAYRINGAIVEQQKARGE